MEVDKNILKELGTEKIIGMFRTLYSIRSFEEKVKFLFLEGKMPGTVHQYIGQEACATGTVAALTEQGIGPGEILVNGWGGGWGEQKHMWEGYMGYSIMRMQDDWGVALAEVMKYDLEDRMDEVPLCVIGGIVLIHDGMTQEEVAVFSHYAYRYSGVVEY